MVSQQDQTEAVRLIDELARSSGIPLTEKGREALVAYSRLLLEWSQRINLTGARSMTTLASDHFPDSFALAKALLPNEDTRPVRVIDVGSGGGLPAIPLALLSPRTTIALFEPIGKKVAFLRTAVRELGLSGRIRVEPSRVVGGGKTGSPPDFDVAISRATLPPHEWLDLGWKLVGKEGRVFALTNRRLEGWPAALTLIGSQNYRGDRLLTEFRRSM